MPKDRRTFIVSNLRRDTAGEDNNDITVRLPDSIFSGKVDAINMKQMYIDFDTETVGSTNFEFAVAYPITNSLTKITLDIDQNNLSIIKTDNQLAQLIASNINAKLGVTVFQTFFDQITISNRDIYRDNSELLGSYTIFTDNNVPFSIDFSSKNSLGPLLGFGNEFYTDNWTYRGGNIPPIHPYESIHIVNKAFDTIFKEYDKDTDIACKMDLYDSNDTLIPNHLDPRDTTISLPVANGYITSLNEFIRLIETELNRYSSAFEGSPVFTLSFDLSNRKFTISNDKNIRFGIGFRFDRNGTNNYGSLHRHLGFNKHIYLGYKSITSLYQAKIFETAYIGEYLFVCSDLIKHNFDAGLIMTESGGRASQYESIFTIPISQIKDGSYNPTFETEHYLRINASRLAKFYNEELPNPKTINFFLKISSGRHIKLNTQWSIKFEIEYTN